MPEITKSQVRKSSKFGKCIKLGRLRLGYSQDELARKLGVASGAIVSNWETGRSLPRVQAIPKLARILNIEASELAQLWLDDSLARRS